MKFRLTSLMLDAAVPVGLGVVLYLTAPLMTALEFHPDEGYELVKAQLLSQGHPLYGELWNDQPPLHTELISQLFGIFGPSAYVARLSSVGFTMMLVGMLYGVASHYTGRAAGLMSVLLLAASPGFMTCGVAVILEPPAMAVAMGSLWAWIRYSDGKGRWWLVGSGVLLGCALQIKLTAALFGPALAAAWFLRRYRRCQQAMRTGRERFWPGSLEVAVWVGSGLAVVSVVGLLYYDLEAISVMWAAHFSPSTREGAVPGSYGFRVGPMLNELHLVIPAIVGMSVIVCQRRWNLLVPVVLLGTMLLVHSWHRPYWHYYRLHFAIPMAWLGGVGITEWFRTLIRAHDSSRAWKAWPHGAHGWLAWSILAALVIAVALERCSLELKRLRMTPSALGNPVVVKLGERAPETRWLYTDRVIYAFWAQLPVPPELAVVSRKRLWSGQLTTVQLIQCLQRYRPEQVLLERGLEQHLGLLEYLEMHYQVDAGGMPATLYLRRSDENTPLGSPAAGHRDHVRRVEPAQAQPSLLGA